MQSGFHRTNFAVTRLSSIFNNSCSGVSSSLGTMINRSVNSNPDCNSVTPLKKGGDKMPMQKGAMGECSNGGKQMFHDEEFPSLSASFSSKPKSKRKTRVDLENCYDKKLDKEVGQISSSQLEVPVSTGHHNNSNFPTSFEKKSLPSASKSPKLPQTNLVHVEGKRSSMFSHDSSRDEPFDICLLETPQHNAPKSFTNKKKSGVWVQKVKSPKDIEQHGLNIIEMNHKTNSFEELREMLRPGMVLFKHYISMSEQVNLVNRCRELGLGTGGFYRPGYKDGAKLRLFMMCLGLDWDPQTKTYGEIRQHDNVVPPCIPCEFTSLVSKILDDSHNLIKKDLKMIDAENMLPQMSPDVCIVNFYSTNGRLGLHQDRDESAESLQKGYPVVSISIGDSAEFLYGDQRDVNKAKSVLLESGDVLIFGGESRHIFHGVTSIIPKTAPPTLLELAKLRPGRLNLTFRKY